jgi:hypothetical protein
VKVHQSGFGLPGRGLEPLRIAPPDPKSDAFSSFATLARWEAHRYRTIVLVFVLERNQTRQTYTSECLPNLKVERIVRSEFS